MKLQRTKYDVIVNLICILLLVGILIYLGLNWSSIPDKIPGHYNALGVVDRWGNKGELFILPIISWILYSGITILERFPQVWNTGVEVTGENKERVYGVLKNMIGTVKLIMVVVFSFLTINTALAKELSLWFVPVFLIVMFGSIIFYIVKLVKVK